MSDYNYGTPLSKELIEEGNPTTALVAIIMGSQSDWSTAESCCALLEKFEVSFEYGVVSAHRTPTRMAKYANEAHARGLKVIIACAGGSAHLPGMVASETTLPVLGFGPMNEKFGPMDVIGSCVRMPTGIPLAFMGLEKPGAINTALQAVRILSLQDTDLHLRLAAYVKSQTDNVPFSVHIA